MTIPTLTDVVINDYHARLLEQIQGEAVETHYGKRPSDEKEKAE